METTVCQAAEINVVEIADGAERSADAISTLSSAEMSFVGGGSFVVVFA